jgi:hypothetical protein
MPYGKAYTSFSKCTIAKGPFEQFQIMKAGVEANPTCHIMMIALEDLHGRQGLRSCNITMLVHLPQRSCTDFHKRQYSEYPNEKPTNAFASCDVTLRKSRRCESGHLVTS